LRRVNIVFFITNCLSLKKPGFSNMFDVKFIEQNSKVITNRSSAIIDNLYSAPLTSRVAFNYKLFLSEIYRLFLPVSFFKFNKLPRVNKNMNFFYNLHKRFLQKLRLTRL
jgi:hypothetical protein